jgi:hypothetical protein
VHDLYATSLCDLAVVQGGLTTSMELTANRRPFICPAAPPLRASSVRHRLERYGAGRCMDYETATPEASQGRRRGDRAQVDYRPVETDGAASGGADRGASEGNRYVSAYGLTLRYLKPVSTRALRSPRPAQALGKSMSADDVRRRDPAKTPPRPTIAASSRSPLVADRLDVIDLLRIPVRHDGAGPLWTPHDRRKAAARAPG